MINVYGCNVQWIDFPSGEAHCRIEPRAATTHITIEFTYGDWGLTHNARDMSHDIVRLMLLADAIQGHGLKIYNIIFDYLPFARQDRRAVEGDAFSLKVFANMVNSLKPQIVTLCDPHSDVAPALFDNVQIITQRDLLRPYFEARYARVGNPGRAYYLIAPDAGAAKKVRASADKWCIGAFEASKQRDPRTGELSNFNSGISDLLTDSDIVMIDDICDGGRTFIELAKAIRCSPTYNENKIILVVSHGLFTHGLDSIKEHINEIWVRGTRIA